MVRRQAKRSIGEAERTMNALRRLVQALRASTAAVEQAAGISGAQLFVLRELVERPGQSLREVGARTLTSQSSVSEVVARLVGRGLVTREAARDDGRRAVLSATPEGRALLRKAPATTQAVLVEGLRRLSPRALARLTDGLEQWLEAAGLGEAPATMFFEPDRRAGDGDT